jgi:DNA helicase IV
LTPHPDLPEEQAYIDWAYEGLEAMRVAARQRMESVLSEGRGGTHQAREERDVIVRTSLKRIEQLDIADRALCFGRIDVAPPDPGDTVSGERFYVGRLAVWGADRDTLVVDWRAPVAEPFYRATGRDPMSLTRRRHFLTERRRLLDIEDELFALDRGRGRRSSSAGDSGADEIPTAGSAALLATLERSRSGHMRDIVATVQREQDEVIRAPLPGVLVVQGGPGTGKTAVALHRAAYLLYTHRFPLERQGVLVVGPNSVFLRYIGQVLPSLGESGVVMSTIDGLGAPVPVRAREEPQVASLKGDARMAAVLAKALADRQRPLRRTVELPVASTVLRITPADSRAAVGAARRAKGSHNARQRNVRGVLLSRLVEQHKRALSARGEPAEVDAPDLRSQIRAHLGYRDALQRMWPKLTAEELLHDLFGSPPLIDLAAKDVLDEAERKVLRRPRVASLDEVPWTSADLPLLDEARMLVGPLSGTADDAETRSYGHIVVDEAQDLTPMQLRMLARRSLSGSMTVVGDIAQATGPSAPAGWSEVVDHLARPERTSLVELSINYRTPVAVMALAARVLEASSPELTPPRPVRAVEEDPVVRAVEASDLAEAVSGQVQTELGSVGDGTVAVVVPEQMTASLTAVLREAGLPAEEAEAGGLEGPVAVVPVGLAKGLEFDSVVVVEPAELEAEAGLRGLYVALTRPTRRLAVVHSGRLPTPLAG